MKPHKQLLLKVFVLIFLFSAGYAEAQSPADLEGTWVLDFDATVELMTSEQQENFNSMDVAVQDAMRADMTGSSYTFMHDRSFATTTAQNEVFTGKWELSEESLTLMYEYGGRGEYQVETLTDNTLIMVVETDSESYALFYRFYLTRTNE